LRCRNGNQNHSIIQHPVSAYVAWMLVVAYQLINSSKQPGIIKKYAHTALHPSACAEQVQSQSEST